MRVAIYPGTFDPVTKGHIHIAERASKIFDKIIIAVAVDNYKNTLFSVEERLHLMEESVSYLNNVEVDCFSGLVADYAKEKKAQALIRGLRAVTDFENEMQIAEMNRHLNRGLETIFLMTAGEYSFISSSIIKQVAVLGGSVQEFVTPLVEKSLKEKYSKNT